MNTSEGQLRLWFGDKVREAILRWFGHVRRRDSGYIGQRMLNVELSRKRKKRKTKENTTSMDELKEESVGVIGLGMEKTCHGAL